MGIQWLDQIVAARQESEAAMTTSKPNRAVGRGAATGHHGSRARGGSEVRPALARVPPLVTLLTVLAVGCPGDRPPRRGDPDAGALWAIVSTCVDRETPAYCHCPAFARSCCGDRATPDADVVWARTAGFVAIRDLEMCGCPAGFVAGLALPRTRVTGIEDPRRPEGIWPFAWGVARARNPDERQIGLALNPADARSQNQRHVHLLRLRPETRAWLDAADGAPPAGVQLAPLPTLDAVFAAVQARVGAGAMADTGILVARARGGGWRAVITRRSSPQAFTLNRCR